MEIFTGDIHRRRPSGILGDTRRERFVRWFVVDHDIRYLHEAREPLTEKWLDKIFNATFVITLFFLPIFVMTKCHCPSRHSKGKKVASWFYNGGVVRPKNREDEMAGNGLF